MRSPNEMRIGLGQFRALTDEKLAFIKQLGADDFLMNTPDLPGTARWELADLVALRERADAAELRLMCLENVPVTFYDKAMLGLPGRDEQIEHMQATIRNMGRAGIPILGYHWMPNQVWRSPERERLRGGALATRFDMAEHGDAPLTHGRVFDEDEMWDNYEYYLRAILPVAEEAGVILALHPDDPPVPSLGGVARIFRNFAGFKRAIDTFDSPNHGLDFCMGCWSEMGPSGVSGANLTPGVLDAVRHFGGRGPDRLRALPRRAGRGAVLQRVLHRRRQPGHLRGGAGAARGGLHRLHDHRPRAGDGGRHHLGPPRPRLRDRLHPRPHRRGAPRRVGGRPSRVRSAPDTRTACGSGRPRR